MQTLEISLESITLQQIKVFLYVARCGGFAKAGEDLHMTQPAVSKSIAKLEKGLGISLFWRNTRNVTLTEAGKLLYEEWSQQIEEINDSYLRARSLQYSEDTTLRVGLLNTARPERYFWNLEGLFRKLHPDIRLILSSEYMTDLEKNLQKKSMILSCSRILNILYWKVRACSGNGLRNHMPRHTCQQNTLWQRRLL